MKKYSNMSQKALEEELSSLVLEYEKFKDQNLKLDMSRGKPSPKQLDLSMGILDTVNSKSDCNSENGLDCRNYGMLDGIIEAKRLFAELLHVNEENIAVFGNASLNIMYDIVSTAMIFGVNGSTPWMKLPEKVKFLCPVPGYDRHFRITETLGIEMINVPMNEDGPDMDMVEELVSKDPMIKGIWCVPKYSNPDGIVYSDAVVRRFAALKPMAEDFRIYWDNAYAFHHIYDFNVEIPEILYECSLAGNSNMVYEFASTSKVSFAGGGVSVLATSKENLDSLKKSMNARIISYDKLNQLRHVRFFKNAEGVTSHMKKHAELLRPRFDKVIEILDRDLKETGIGRYTKPNGGYFIALYTEEGCAAKIIDMCKKAGVVLTGAGAPFPYGKDPKDCVIRIAPSYPSVDELEKATELLAICTKITALEKLLRKVVI